ncbi:unnamed protein product [Rotaria sordida]|uniref:Uncharacterized protein n=1 Tax=Rotaria sordida TaxID=392033 RepID=A0A819XHC1_9BILA|nr:unnamed protein product [Rotaria sordida]CAF4141090.1 unnamed protein product [Rotaria sordida]
MARVANELISAPPLSDYSSEKEMVDLLFDALKSVLLGDLYSIEQESTPDYDDVQDEDEDEKFEGEDDNAEIDSDFDIDVEIAGSVSQAENLSLEYMTGALKSDRIKENLFNASNVVVTCSASGKLTTSLVSYWVDKILRPSLSGKTLLISDCWNGQGDNKGLYDGIKGLFRIEIPAKTTSYRQPLDVYFNRKLKVLARRIYE